MKVVQGPLAAVLCFSLAASPLPGSEAKVDAPNAANHGQLQGDDRILHTLNRFTFGPRPGDLDSVRAMGLDRWFDQQLHPASIDNTALQGRLAQFPAMTWSPEDLLFRLPSKAVIRQIMNGKLAMPDRGALYAVYENEVARLTAKREQKQQEQKQTATAQNGMEPPAPTMVAIQQAAKEDAPGDANAMAASPSGSVPSLDPALISTVLALPPGQRVARLTHMSQPEFDAFFKSLRGPQRLALTADMTPDLKETVGALENPERVVVEELMAQRLTRDIYSNAQLQEVMTDFWLNHFNVFLRKNESTPYYLVSYERDVIRPHALGKFEDLLEAVAHSPAMLIYLDNAESIGPDSPAATRAKIAAARNPDKKKKPSAGLNENYARELMELHTLGVNGGYTQADVIQAARILTGWTVDKPQRGGGFRFDENRHEPGTKKVLGQKFKEHGEREGHDLLHMLATRPATAQFISRKLAVRFVSDDPPKELVDRMAKAYLSSGGDFPTVLKAMFRSPEFWAPEIYRAKVKTPLEYVVSATRASNAELSNMQPLVNALREMGMPLYGCIPPTGYKWDASDWVSTGALVNRMNFALSLAANRLNGVSTTWSLPSQGDTNSTLSMLDELDSDGTAPKKTGPSTPAIAATSPTPENEEARLENWLIAGGVGQTTRAAVLQQFEQQSGQSKSSPPSPMNVTITQNQPRRAQAAGAIEKQDQLLAGLLLGSPEFQRR